MVYIFGLLGSCCFFINSLSLLFSMMLSAACVRKSKVFRAGQQGLASSWFSLAVLHSFEQLTIPYSSMHARLRHVPPPSTSLLIFKKMDSLGLQ